MKILIITSGYFPGRKYGGPPVSVDNFCSLMSGVAECYIVTHNHDMGESTPYSNIIDGWSWNDRGNSHVLYLSDKDYNAVSFERVVRDVLPDYIYLQSLFQSCVISCLALAKKYRIQVVLAPRGELCAGAFKKKLKKIPYIYFLRTAGLLSGVSYQSTSIEETNAIRKYLNASSGSIHYLTNIPSVPQRLRARETKQEGVGRFIFVSRILWKKNLLSAIMFLRAIKGSVRFDIYGPKEDMDYWGECESEIKALPDNVSVEYKGILSHDDIHAAFSKYDAFLFPTLSENFGHVIAEALASGCIPIISDQTPWSDINEYGAGWAISLADINLFKNAIQEVVDMDEATISLMREKIGVYLKDKFNLDQLKANYMSVFK